tara:strand:- start:69 stop:449 length:381 start_codon:yes stop_codon:yes gene_type:complete
LSVKKIARNGVIKNLASQYDFSQKQYSTLNISKNSSAKNLSEVEASITTVRNNQDFLVSKDNVEPSVLTTNYSHRELSHFNNVNATYVWQVDFYVNGNLEDTRIDSSGHATNSSLMNTNGLNFITP